MFKFCQFVEYLALDDLIYVHLQYPDIKLSKLFWDSKEIHSFPDKRLPSWAKCIFKV